MKKLLTVVLSLLFVTLIAVGPQATATSALTQDPSNAPKKRGPVFRATKDQINQAQAVLKSRGFFSGEPNGKLDDATREGLRKYQAAESIKVTGTLNKPTLEKMGIVLTERQKAM
jgi:peptidoglycan hydrolase-like protein with peptidoglycan-binding domain